MGWDARHHGRVTAGVSYVEDSHWVVAPHHRSGRQVKCLRHVEGPRVGVTGAEIVASGTAFIRSFRVVCRV